MRLRTRTKYLRRGCLACATFALSVLLSGINQLAPTRTTWFNTRSVSSFKCSRDDVCTLKNVCLDRSNVFQFFLPLGADASVVRGRLKSVNLVAAWQLSPEEYNTLLPLRIVLANESVTMKRMRFFDEPIFVHIMLAVGNFGHTFLQNALPAVLSMSHSSLKHRHPFQTIALNDCKACGFPNPSDHTCMDGIGSFGYTSCDSVRASVYKAITGHGLKFSRELFESGESHLCFRNVVVGFPGGNRFDMLYNPSAEHFSYEKQLVRTRSGVPNSLSTSHATREIWKSRATINVGVYCKDVSKNGRHGNTFLNCHQFVQSIRSLNIWKGKISASSVNFDNAEFNQQLEQLQNFDIYISDGGSSSYYTHFLRAGAVSLTFPLCDDSCACVHLFTDTYTNPVVVHIPVDPIHVKCRMNPSRDGIFKPLFDVRQSFKYELSKALKFLQ